MTKEITIRYGNNSGYDVLQDGLSSGGGLTVGEMIEQVLSITLADTARRKLTEGRAVYRLKPQKEWKGANPQCERLDMPFFPDDVGSGA